MTFIFLGVIDYEKSKESSGACGERGNGGIYGRMRKLNINVNNILDIIEQRQRKGWYPLLGYRLNGYQRGRCKGCRGISYQ
jgi:hypothetical protein